MRVLLDHCVPWRLGPLLVGHEVRTARQSGLEELVNGELMRQASVSFDVLLTVDRSMQYQHDLRTIPLGLIIVASLANRLDSIEPRVPQILAVLEVMAIRSAWRIEVDGSSRVLFDPLTP